MRCGLIIICEDSQLQEENVAKDVGATSSKGCLVLSSRGKRWEEGKEKERREKTEKMGTECLSQMNKFCIFSEGSFVLCGQASSLQWTPALRPF